MNPKQSVARIRRSLGTGPVRPAYAERVQRIAELAAANAQERVKRPAPVKAKTATIGKREAEARRLREEMMREQAAAREPRRTTAEPGE